METTLEWNLPLRTLHSRFYLDFSDYLNSPKEHTLHALNLRKHQIAPRVKVETALHFFCLGFRKRRIVPPNLYSEGPMLIGEGYLIKNCTLFLYSQP